MTSFPWSSTSDLWASVALRRELSSVSLDPYTLREIKRGFLPVGTLVEAATAVLQQAAARHIGIVTIRVRASQDSQQVDVVQVSVEALRAALGL
jgi:ribosomal protein L13E